MKYLALAISINNEIPSYNVGLMQEIVKYFVSKGYTVDLINDKTTRPKGFYMFKTNQEKFQSLDEFHNFLDSFKERGVKYKLTSLEDAFEAGLILAGEDKGEFIFKKYYGAYPSYMWVEK